jgi:hypothetical protein
MFSFGHLNRARFVKALLIPLAFVTATVPILSHTGCNRATAGETNQVTKLSDSVVSNTLIGYWRSALPTPKGSYFFEKYNPGGTARWAAAAASRTNPAALRGAALDGRWYVSNGFLCWWYTTTNPSLASRVRSFEVHRDRIISISSTSYVSFDSEGATNKMVRTQPSQKQDF